jgi:hypothetical protein
MMQSISAPVFRAPLTPQVESPTEWLDLLRTDPDALLAALVQSVTTPSRPVVSGHSIEEVFTSHIASLSPTAGPPSLYHIIKSFWFPTSPAYFTLTTPSSTTRSSSEHRFMYWDPASLVFNAALPCPHCGTNLVNKGRIASGPIKVHDLGRPFYIIGCEYLCPGGDAAPMDACRAAGPNGRAFSSVDQAILRALPERLRDEFPAVLINGDGAISPGPRVWNWATRGVSKEMWNMVKGCLRVGANRVSVLEVIRGVHDGVPDDLLVSSAQQEEEEEEDIYEPEGDVVDDQNGKVHEGVQTVCDSTFFVIICLFAEV